MKTFQLFSFVALFLTMSLAAFSQSRIDSFSVSGNCGMCKANIEKAAVAAGANTASWDAETKQLTVKYRSSSTNTAKIQQKIADAGYDNAGFKTTTAAYQKLHACCQYDRSESAKADCCKDGKCTKEGHNGSDCCKKDH
jgi:mercuric ion binding protein